MKLCLVGFLIYWLSRFFEHCIYDHKCNFRSPDVLVSLIWLSCIDYMTREDSENVWKITHFYGFCLLTQKDSLPFFLSFYHCL